MARPQSVPCTSSAKLYPLALEFIGSFGLAVVQIMFTRSSYLVDKGVPPLIPSYGASAVLIYSVLDGHLAHPRALIGDHVLSAILGTAISKLFLLSKGVGMGVCMGCAFDEHRYGCCGYGDEQREQEVAGLVDWSAGACPWDSRLANIRKGRGFKVGDGFHGEGRRSDDDGDRRVGGDACKGSNIAIVDERRGRRFKGKGASLNK
ncbi:hypothetical protein BKA70DRAFT_450413 [Coprinopsis sp. MPI-PUGE-AT-0042]|nr:hypothetical protein BKA70DRAFT_450413 [Coprinopsis sp. MPI-PUGE-AT-0042]